MYGGYFNSKEEAEKYKSEHELYVMAAEYITCKKQWALVFLVHTVSDSGTVYCLHPLQSADITYEDFENFMLQLIV